jgi:carnosine N-methyltransferase
LWHWENNTTNDPSIELDLEEVKLLCRKIGFKLEVEIVSDYVHDCRADRF